MNKTCFIMMLLAIMLVMFTNLGAQTYLSESFEGTWSGTPAVPSGWTNLHTAPTGGSGGTSPLYWAKNTWSGSVWSSTSYGAPTAPTGAYNGSSVAWYNDFSAKSTQKDQINTPVVNLSAAVNPRVSFFMAINASSSVVIKLRGSVDGGTNWADIQTLTKPGTAWTKISVPLTGTYKVATAMFGIEVTATYGSYDVWVDQFVIDETPTPLSGIKTINPAGSGTDNYTTFTAAILALNDAGISAPVTFNVAAGATFNENCPALTATGTSSNTITFQKSGAGANPKIIPTGSTGSSDAAITINGGDYITFDGIDIDASAVTTVEYGYYIINASATNGAQYNTIKNFSVTLNRNAAYANVAVFQYYILNPSSAAGANSYNKYYNFNIANAITGVFLYGSSLYRDLSCEVGTTSTALRNVLNNLGPQTITTTSAKGIHAYNQNGVKIFNNDVTNVASDQSVSYGIYLQAASGTGNAIYNNKIAGISVKGSTTTTSTATGLKADLSTSGTNNVKIYNNFISNVFTSFTGTATASRYAYGMFIGVSSATTSQSYDIDNNNVSIGSGLTPNYSNTCLELQNSSPVLNVRGNIFANYTNAQTGVAKHFGIVVTAAGLGGTGTSFDYNDYYIANSQSTSGHVGRDQSTTTNYNTVADWKTFTTGTLDENSISTNPVFIDNNTDLHVASSSVNAVSGYSTQAWVTTDFDYEVRSGLTPSDIGADAFTPTIDTPSAFASTTVSNGAIDLTFTPVVNNVVIVWNNTGTFTTPSGTPPSNVGDAFAGGYFLYNGLVSPVNHTGLTALTTYYYKAFSYNGAVYSLGLSASATTYGVPAVTTTAATSITHKSAVVGGNVTAESGSSVTERGVCYGTSLNPTTSDIKVTTTGTTGAYTIPITGLAYSATYHFRAYAINAYGTSYGSDMTFTTNGDPTITSFPYTEGFNGTTFPPIGWDNYGVLKTNGSRTSDAFWSRVTSGTYNATAGAAKIVYNHTATIWGCLELPPVNIPANHSLTFYWKDADSKIAGADTTFVEISTNNGLTWTVLSQLAAASSQSTYSMADISLSSYAGNGRLIRFRDGTNASMSAYGTFVDELKIAEATNPPNVVTTPTPGIAATGVAINTNLSWVSGGGSPTGYKVYLGTSSGNLSQIADVATTTYTMTSNLQFGVQYFWRVDAYNIYGTSTGTEWSFTTASGLANTPAPTSGSTNQDATNRVLNWADVPGATSYKVRVGTSAGNNDLVDMAEVSISQYTHSVNWPWSSTIYWTIFTVNGGQEVQGTEWNFATGTNPTITAPLMETFASFPPTNWSRWTGLLANPSTLSTTTSGWTSDGFANNGTTGAVRDNVFSTGHSYWLITPPIDLGGAKAANYNLEFDLALTDYSNSNSITSDPNGTTGTDDKFAVVISTDGSTWSSANALRIWDNAGSPYVYNNIATAGEHVTIDISAYTGIVKIAFYAESTVTNADNDLFVDNFAIVASNLPPTAVTTGTPTNNAVDQGIFQPLSWGAASNNPTGYRLYLSTDGENFTLQSTQATSTYTPSVAWTYSQKYYWRVDAYNEHGEATGPVWNFTVMADPTIYTLPYLNDFESNINGWTILNSNGDSKLWARTADTAPNYAMMIGFNGSLAMDDWFVTPPVQLTAGVTYEVKYNYKAASASFPENLAVAWGTMPTAAALTHVIADHPGIVNLTYNVGRGTFTPSTTGAYYIGFHGYSDIDMFNLFVDNVRITTADNDLVNATATTSSGTSSPNPQPIYNPVTNSALDTALTITGLSGTPTIVATVGWNNPAVGMGTDGLYVRLSGTEFNNTHVNITHNLGFIPAQIIVRAVGSPEWTVLNPPTEAPLWTAADSFFDIYTEIFAKANAIEVVFPAEQDQTLPIELSSFTATLTADMFVQIAWMVQSETNHMGYNILRNTERDLNTAVAINADFISDGDQLGSQISYSYIDGEVDNNTTYYYWLQSFDLGGTAQFYGPLTVLVSGNPDDPGIPVIPVVTQLMDAYPNPFNPSTTLRYGIKDAGKVRIDVFNVRGQLLRSFENDHATPGYYSLIWDGKDASGNVVGSGMYLYRMTSGKFVSTKKVVMSK